MSSPAWLPAMIVVDPSAATAPVYPNRLIGWHPFFSHQFVQRGGTGRMELCTYPHRCKTTLKKESKAACKMESVKARHTLKRHCFIQFGVTLTFWHPLSRFLNQSYENQNLYKKGSNPFVGFHLRDLDPRPAPSPNITALAIKSQHVLDG